MTVGSCQGKVLSPKFMTRDHPLVQAAITIHFIGLRVLKKNCKAKYNDGIADISSLNSMEVYYNAS